ncbi:hypothetical protein ACP4OV_020824 [Aristida adscensionis]
MGEHQQQSVMGGGLELPPGFRFHPTDEEIIVFYLTPKVIDRNFIARAIAEVDLNKSEPWDLPGKAKMGEKEWYFYCQKDRKYPTGMRTNRATEAGYWKATGKDKEIYRAMTGALLLVGMKKTLVFYRGRAPRGDKTNWVMHEYRLEGSGRPTGPTSSSTSASASTITMKSSSSSSKDDWVVCRVFHKNSGIRRASSYQQTTTTANSGTDQRSSMPMPMPIHMPMPVPMQFPMGPEDFIVDSNALRPLTDSGVSFFGGAGASSSSMPPLPGIGSGTLQMNGLFGNPMVMTQPLPLYHQMGMGADQGAGDGGGYMVDPDSGPSSMVSQNTGMSPDQANTIEISSVVPGTVPVTNMDMDGIWKQY